MSSSQCARGLLLFLVPPPIPNIIDFSQLFSLRMIGPKYDSRCFVVNASSGVVCVSFIRTTMKVQLDTEIAIQI